MKFCRKTSALGILFFVTINSMGMEMRGTFSQDAQHFYATENLNSRNFSRTQLKTIGQFLITRKLKFKLDQTIHFSKAEYDKANSLDASGDRFGFMYTDSDFDFFAGAFTLTSDGPDLNSPFDVVNAKDYMQPFQSLALGSFGLHFNTTIDSLNAQIFYFPQQTRSRLPSLNSIWWPRSQTLPLTNSAGTFYIAKDIEYKLKSETEVENPFENAYGAQMKYTLDNIDLFFFFFKGANQTPLIYPELNIDATSIDPPIGTLRSPIELNYTWYASTHAGIGTSYVMGDWIIKGFYKQQNDKLAIEKKSTTATYVIESSLSLGRFSLRYFLQNNRTWKRDGLNELQTLLGFFDRSSSLGFLLDAEIWGSYSGVLIYNESKGGLLSSLNYEYMWTDHLKTKLTINSLSPSNDIIGKVYDKTDNAVISLHYDFRVF